MKRIVIIMAIFAALIFSLTACSDIAQKSNGASPSIANSSPSAKINNVSPNLASPVAAPPPSVSASDSKSSESPTNSQTPSSTQTKLQPSDAAKIAANLDSTGAPYFITYDYDTTYYLVSAYTSQHGPGNYTGGSSLFFVNKYTGKVLANPNISLNKVNFSKYLTVYSKLSGKIIE